MKKKYLISLLVLLHALQMQAEIFHLYTIVDSAIESDTVVEANYLGMQNNLSTFLIHEFNNEESHLDTLVVKGLDECFDDLQAFENSEKVILYLKRNADQSLSPIVSGIRILEKGKVYLPLQVMIPGRFSFLLSNDNISWLELKRNIADVKVRVDEIKKIRQTNDNQELLQWINNQGESLIELGARNENKGWGTIGFEVFRWITENNIAQDTWKASQLYRKIHFSEESGWDGFTGILDDYNGSSFRNYDHIDFLIATAQNTSNSIIDRRQALSYLADAARLVYDNNHPIPPLKELDEQKIKQKYIRDQILPLLANDGLKQFAFQVVRLMSSPMDGNLKHRIDLEVIPIIKKYYLGEVSGTYKSDLAKFLVYNSSKEEWKELSNCDEGLFVDLYSLLVDVTKNSLSFFLRLRNGHQQFKESPNVEIINKATGMKIYDQVYPNAKLDRLMMGARTIILQDLELDEGHYQLRVVGSAGEDSQYHWETEFIDFLWIRPSHH